MDDMVKSFQNACNCSEEEAKHYLEAYSNDLNEAVSAYLSQNQDSPVTEEKPITAPTSSKPASKFATLSTINPPSKCSCGSDSDDEEGQAFYVGGSLGGGGQQVLGPRKDKKLGEPSLRNPDELISRVFRGARESGAEELGVTRVADADTGPSRTPVFTGSGYRLGTDLAQQSEMVTPSTSAGASSSQDTAVKPTVIKMWNNGFSINDGPLRAFDDPESMAFLKAIQRGDIPQELMKAARGGQTNVMMEDHRGEEYKAPPKPKIVPFSGSGQMLGHPTPKISASNSNAQAESAGPRPPAPEVDRSKPVTKLQVRLADGTRIQVELNHSHNVGHIRQAIISQRPTLADQTITLMTTFPNKELTDDTLSLEEGKLLNCALVQK